jgi:hypothetical protein
MALPTNPSWHKDRKVVLRCDNVVDVAVAMCLVDAFEIEIGSRRSVRRLLCCGRYYLIVKSGKNTRAADQETGCRTFVVAPQRSSLTLDRLHAYQDDLQVRFETLLSANGPTIGLPDVGKL